MTEAKRAHSGKSVQSPPNETLASSGAGDERAHQPPHDRSSHARADSVWLWLSRLLPIAAWTGLSAFYYGKFLAHSSQGVPGGPDGILYAWFFESVHQSVIHLQNPLVSYSMNAPDGVNLMWNTSLLLVAIACTPLTAFIGALPTVGLLMAMSPILTSASAYFVLRHLTRVTWGSALAATLYGFGPFFIGQNGHLHLILAAPLLPLILLLGHRMFVTQDRGPVRTGGWLGAVVGAGVLVSEEMIAMAGLIAAGAVLALALVNLGKVRARMAFVAVGVATTAVTTLVIAGVPLMYQFFGPYALHGGVPAANQSLNAAGFTHPSGLQFFASRADITANGHFLANGVENTGYLGWPLIVVVLVGCVWFGVRRERFVYWWVATTTIAVLLALGSKIEYFNMSVANGPWALLERLPVIQGIVTVRFSVVVTLLVALFLAWALSKVRSHVAIYAAGLLVVLTAFIPLVPAGPFDEIQPLNTPTFFRTSAVVQIPRGSIVLVLPYDNAPGPAAQVMAWQIEAHLRFRIIGGYSVFSQGGVMSYHGAIPEFARLLATIGRGGVSPSKAVITRARKSIMSSGISYIVVTRFQRHRDLVTAMAERLTECTPRNVLDVTLCKMRGDVRPRPTFG